MWHEIPFKNVSRLTLAFEQYFLFSRSNSFAEFFFWWKESPQVTVTFVNVSTFQYFNVLEGKNNWLADLSSKKTFRYNWSTELWNRIMYHCKFIVHNVAVQYILLAFITRDTECELHGHGLCINLNAI